MPYERIKFEKSGGLGICTLDRPEVLNALDQSTYKELLLLLEEVWEDDSVKVLILMGAGKAFCSGTDVGGIRSGEIMSAVSLHTGLRAVTRSIEKLPKPVIAAIHGYALGGGLELALSCDFRIASEDAELGFPEINLGLFPGAGGTQRLPRLIGVTKAKKMIFFGERVSSKEAEKIGLVDAIAPTKDLLKVVTSFAYSLKEKPSIALAMSKAVINRVWEGESLEAGLRYEYEAAHLLSETEDMKEGTRAFLERRKPKWKGA